MAKNRFAKSGTTRLALADGEDWIEVKDSLSYHEQKKLETSAIERMREGAFEIDLSRYHIERMMVYLTEWSFRDDRDKAVKLDRDSIRNLDMATADEINALLDTHVEAVLGKSVSESASPAPNGTAPNEPAGNLTSVASGDGVIPSY